MDGWLKENKAYVITVGSMVAGVALVYMLILGPISSDAEGIGKKLRMQENVYRSKAQRGVPDEGALSDAKRDREAERTSLKGEVKRLKLKLDGKFLSKGDDGYREHFEEIKLDIRQGLDDLNGARGLGEFPSDLGWKSVSIASQEEGRAALVRLGVGKGVLEAVIASLDKGEKIETVNIFQDHDRDGVDENSFLRRVPVMVTVTASSKSIFRTIHLFQKAGSYFCLESIKVQRAATSGTDSFEAHMIVSGLLIDESAPPPFESSEEDYE